MNTQHSSNELSKEFELLNASKNKEAKEIFIDVLKQSDRNARALYGLGICTYREGSLSEAEELFTKSLNIAPNNYNAHYYHGMIEERQGRPKEAIEKYMTAVSIKPDCQEATQRLTALGVDFQKVKDNWKSNSVGQKQNNSDIEIDGGAPQFICNQKALTFLSERSNIVVILIVLLVIILMLEFGGIFLNLGKMISALVVGALVIWFLTGIRKLVTEYRFYTDRIEIQQGLFLRKLYTVWNFQIKSVVYRRNPLYWLVNSGVLVLELDQAIPSIGQSKLKLVTGIGAGVRLKGLIAPGGAKKAGFQSSDKFMRHLWKALRDSSLQQRRSIKKWWI